MLHLLTTVSCIITYVLQLCVLKGVLMEGPACSLGSASVLTSGRGMTAHKVWVIIFIGTFQDNIPPIQLFAGPPVLMVSAQPQTCVPVWRAGLALHALKVG